MMKGCQEIVDMEGLNFLLQDSPELLEKYEKFKLNIEVLIDKNKKFCPTVNCGSYGQRRNDNEKYIQCENGHKYCFQCLGNWHGKTPCDEVFCLIFLFYKILDKEFDKWKKGKTVKMCPSCKFWTEKNEGCNHMTCRACSHQWCWLCCGAYTSSHYTTGPCSGLQFNRNPIYQNRCWRCFHKFYFILGMIFMYIGIIVGCLLFGSAALACVFIWEGLNTWHMSRKSRVGLCIVACPAAIIFQPLLLLLSVVLLGLAIGFFPITILIIKKMR
jgi:hypothetical protein